MPYYPRRKTYRRKRTYKRKSMPKKRYNKRRRTYRKKADSGTFLKISSSALPVVINNKSAAQSAQYALTPDTFQTNIRFKIGDTEGGETIQINNEINLDNDGLPRFFAQNDVYLGSSDLLSRYQGLYKYMQVYKIVVKFTPAITEGGVLSPTTGSYYPNAISGHVTTDIDSGNFLDRYIENYPPTLDGNAKANSRKVSRERKITRSWTRTFVPKQFISDTVPNPRAKYQYKPEKDLSTTSSLDDGEIELSGADLIIRMRKPQLAGFTATSIEGTEIDFPEIGSFVRYGTMMVHAYVKFRSPIY